MTGQIDRKVTRRQLDRRLSSVEASAAVDQAALDVAEGLRARKSALRVEGTYDLAQYATHRATGLANMGRLTDNDPELEQIHRGFRNVAAVVSSEIIYDYGTGS